MAEKTAGTRRRPRRVIAVTAIGIAAVMVLGVAAVGISGASLGLSIQAQTIRLAAPVLFAEDPSDPEVYRRQVLKSQQAGPSLPSTGFRSRYIVTETTVEGSTVITASPQSTPTPGLTILYLHGGGYVADVSFVYWDLVDRLIQRTGATVVLPLYPLAPTSTWRPAHALALTVYQGLVDTVGASKVVIAGDSAGGGMALAIAEEIRDAGMGRPAGLVLFSPWVDATLSDPSQPALDTQDALLSIHGLRDAARWWAGDLPTSDHRISPLFGSLTGLPPIALFTATEDLLYPDATRLEAKAKASGVQVTMFTYPHEQHAWAVLFPAVVPEAQRAIDQASTFILDMTR